MQENETDATRRLFGRVLKHLRTKEGLSLRKLAQAAHYDVAWLSRTENGDYLPPAATVAHIDAALNAGGILTALRVTADAPSSAAPRTLVAGDPEDDGVMLDLQTPEGGSIRVRISRRDFNRLIATGSLASVFPGLEIDEADRLSRTLRNPTRIDDQVLGYFRRVLAEHFAADQALGPRRLLPPVLAQIGVLDGLRKQARDQDADAVLQVLAQYAEMAGWLHQDLGHLDEAMRWSSRAAEWARCAGDHQMAAYMLVRQANIACLTDDHAAVVQYAAGARKTPDLDPKLTALASQQEARGHALRGDRDAAARLLSDAAALLDDHPAVTRPGAPVYLEHYNQETLQEQSALCLRLVGDITTAAIILERKIDLTPEALIRDRGHLTVKLAVTLTYSSDLDPVHVAELGLKALEAARQTGSARIYRELTELDRQLNAYRAQIPDVRLLHEALAAS